LHPNPDSSKFPPQTFQSTQKFGAPLSCDGGHRAGVGGKFQLPVSRVGNVNSHRERARQEPANDARQCLLAVAAGVPFGQGGVRAEDVFEGLRETHHGGLGARDSGQVTDRPGRQRLKGAPLNIILVSSATARARTLTLDWRHWTLGSLLLAVVFVAFTGVFNFVTLKYAAAIQHPWLQAIVLADQRQEALKTQQLVQGHLNAMALRLGELQAQMMRLDGLGEHLAKVAGLRPQELPSLQSGKIPGRGGADSSLPSRALSVDEFSELLTKLGRQMEERTDQLSVLEALLVQDSANRKFMPTLAPIVDGWFSSNFGYRIDPFTGLQTYHEGIDFPAESGTPIVAAASGKVIDAGLHPQYGKILAIDHGNGLVSRYAHASEVFVSEGDLVMRGQRVATVGSTGRSTGPHLHFEVRLNGVPQNPVRFLRSAG